MLTVKDGVKPGCAINRFRGGHSDGRISVAMLEMYLSVDEFSLVRFSFVSSVVRASKSKYNLRNYFIYLKMDLMGTVMP